VAQKSNAMSTFISQLLLVLGQYNNYGSVRHVMCSARLHCFTVSY